MLNPFRVGTEAEVDGVYMKRVKRKPVLWECTNDHMVTVLLQKAPKGQKRWDVLLPEGGLHTFRTKRKAIEFISRLVKLTEEDPSTAGLVL